MDDAKETFARALSNPYIALFVVGVILVGVGLVGLKNSVQVADQKTAALARDHAQIQARISLAEQSRDNVHQEFRVRYEDIERRLAAAQYGARPLTGKETAQAREQANKLKPLVARSEAINAKIILAKGEAAGRAAEAEFYRRTALANVWPILSLIAVGILLTVVGWLMWRRDHLRKAAVT